MNIVVKFITSNLEIQLLQGRIEHRCPSRRMPC